jgi:hypothetical protein
MSFVTEQKRLAKLSMDELLELRNRIEKDPKSKEGLPEGSLWLFNAKARKRLDAIAWAITYKLGKVRAGEAP